MKVEVDRQRLGDADGVGQLNGAAIRQLGCDDVLGQIARHVGSGAVDLGGILAGKGPATVWRGTAIGIDNDLAPGQAGIAVRVRR